MKLPSMNAVFRVDASLQMGTGHVMRCLTLADSLRSQGARCHFISRQHPGHLFDVIRENEFALLTLPESQVAAGGKRECDLPAHASWLGSDWRTDADRTLSLIARLKADLLIVDHYSLDRCWEDAVRSACTRVLVIDDLADRLHRCEVLLDQNLGRCDSDYSELVGAGCELMIGPDYALLRPEFSTWRSYSLQRRRRPAQLSRLLISMGGVDQLNATGKVLDVLKSCALPADCQIRVVMGQRAPFLQRVREQALQLPWPVEVLVGVRNIAELMANADLAIGAAGITAWERCCLGVPAIVVVLADNQRDGAQALAAAGAVSLIRGAEAIAGALPEALDVFSSREHLLRMSQAAGQIVDGRGIDRVVQRLGDTL